MAKKKKASGKGAKKTTAKTKGGVRAKAKGATKSAAGKKKSAGKRKAVAKKKVQPIPSQYSSVIPSFRVARCGQAVEFLQQLFGAKVKDRYEGPNGEVVHAELRIGDTTVMCGEAQGADVKTLAASVYVKDCDGTFEKAVSLGANAKQPPADQFYGDRSGRIVDPFGNEWVIATHVEDVSRREMLRRMQQMPPPPQATMVAQQ